MKDDRAGAAARPRSHKRRGRFARGSAMSAAGAAGVLALGLAATQLIGAQRVETASKNAAPAQQRITSYFN